MLDLYDKNILYELDKKSKISVQELSKKLKRSKQFVIYRIKKLEDLGIITGYTAIVDMSKLGYFSFRIYFKMRQITLEQEKEFVVFIQQKYKQVWAITTMHGAWDFALFLGVKSVMELHEIWDGILLLYKKQIKHYNIAVYAPVYNFNRKIFIDIEEQRIERIYGEGGDVNFDKLDLEIIYTHATDVRKSSRMIAQELGIAADTVRSRIKILEREKVICGYKIGLDLSKLGYVSYRVDLDLHSTEENKKLFEFCKQHKNIYQINKSIGGADFEIEAIVQNEEELQKIIDELKSTFIGIIDDVEYFRFSTFHILKYIPD